jgi:hypothetical protein
MRALVLCGVLLAPAFARADPLEPDHFYVRGGVALIDPLSTSKPMELANVDGPASWGYRSRSSSPRPARSPTTRSRQARSVYLPGSDRSGRTWGRRARHRSR